MFDELKRLFVPIHPGGWMFIAGCALGAFVLGALWDPLGWVGFALTAFCAYFFRDPARVSPQREGLILSPADGIVHAIEKVSPPEALGLGEAEHLRITVLLNLFDVHVNRVPAGGKVTALDYVRGAFFNPSLDKAHEENERQLVKFTLADGTTIGMVQIAGLISRRIVCDLHEGQEVKAGERFGMIRFGSRLDVYLPANVNPLAIVGQRAIAGETVLADLKSHEPVREGVRS